MLIDKVHEYMILVRLDRTAARGDIEMESGSNVRLSVYVDAELEFANAFLMLKLMGAL